LTGTVIQLNKGDILGHEFCGVVDQVGPAVKNIKVGKRYVASFQIACGDVRRLYSLLFRTRFICLELTVLSRQCFYCKQKLSSQCEVTNSNTIMKAMYGSQTAGLFGYSHLAGGFAGGQAEYVRVPLADVNLLEIPDDIPDEKGM
jgi:threonine dehydrogenase-like Zn-dependent dehydrogenase